MTLLNKIDQDLKEALKSGNRDAATVLRGLKSDIKYKQISVKDDLSEEQITEVLSSAAKKRKESIEQFEKGGRDELAQKEQSELEIISKYLPKQLDEEELKPIIQEAIAEAGVTTPDKIGLVMKVLMPKVKGKADGKLVKKLVIEILAN